MSKHLIDALIEQASRVLQAALDDDPKHERQTKVNITDELDELDIQKELVSEARELDLMEVDPCRELLRVDCEEEHREQGRRATVKARAAAAAIVTAKPNQDMDIECPL